MGRGLLLVLVALLATPRPLAAADPAELPKPRVEASTGLAERLGRILARRELAGASVAALVVRDRDGGVLFEKSAAKPMTPASNLKVLTAAAVLARLGPTYRFATRFSSDAAPGPTGAVEWLAVRGAGDPATNSEDWWLAAAGLRQQGLHRVTGDLLLDDGVFDRVRWHPAWGQTSSRAYHAPVGALSANYGSFSVTVHGGEKAGDPVKVTLEPPVPYLALSNRARTGAPRSRSTLVVDRAAGEGDERVIVRGSVPAGGEPRTYYRSVLDPTAYAGAVLRMQLEAVGIQVGGRVRAAPTPPNAHELYVHEGRDLAEVVRLFMKFSNNAVAESLVKALAVARGQVGSWSAGLAEMRAALLDLGVLEGDLQLVDGSGLSYDNRVTPRALVHVLQRARRSFDFGPELLAALPIAARDGTLEKRAAAADGSVRAKTGLLNGVTGLSGLARLGSDEVAIFSVIVNGYRCSDEQAMDVLDRFAAELASPVGS